MRLAFSQLLNGRREGTEVFKQTIAQKDVQPDAKVSRQPRLWIRKSGRLVDVNFRCTVNLAGEATGHLFLTEGEIFRLAKLCRRDRTTEQLVKAIDVA